MEGKSGVSGSPDTRYKFTGKERDTETGYDYFGARYYDARIGRWLAVDPLTEKYPAWSPYDYAMDNPINLVDPNGMEVRKHWSASGNTAFTRAWDLYIKTDLGAKQYERLHGDTRILVIYAVSPLGRNRTGTTNWISKDYDKTYPLDGVNYEVNGRRVIVITLDPKWLLELRENENAETIFHEGRAHVEYELDKGNLDNLTSPQDQHKIYGRAFKSEEPRKDTDAYEFIQQLKKILGKQQIKWFWEGLSNDSEDAAKSKAE